MQVLDVQPTNPTPYTPVTGTYNNNPTPGAGGLPALSGLTRNVNPMAAELQSQGRNQDTMLVHMTPNEVNSLQGLAMAHGGSLTVNPNTGLPEAGFLSKILPIVAGIAGSFVGIPPWVTAAAVGGVTGIASGDLQKGLMAGLSAYGGASLGSALTAAPATPVVTGAAEVGAAAPVVPAAATAASMPVPVAEGLAGAPGLSLPGMAPSLGGAQIAAQLPGMAPAALAPTAVVTPPAFTTPVSKGILGKFGTDFSAAAREGLKAGTLPYKLAPYAAGLGITNTASELLQPQMPTYEKPEDKWKYEGPYRPMPRRLNPRVQGPGEILYFEDTNPYPGYLTAAGNVPTGLAEGGEATKRPIDTLPEMVKMFQTSPGPITASRTYPGGSPSQLIRAAAQANAAMPKSETDFGFNKSAGTAPVGGFNNPDYTGYINDYFAKYGYPGMSANPSRAAMQLAKGGGIHMDDGAFVVDARTVSELGNGSSSAGQELLARLGGHPVKGPGDGVSDSIPANIGGTQEARVARDEVIIPAEAVKKLGGAKKLYALMDKAHKARKGADRGEDTKLRKGLEALG